MKEHLICSDVAVSRVMLSNRTEWLMEEVMDAEENILFAVGNLYCDAVSHEFTCWHIEFTTGSAL